MRGLAGAIFVAVWVYTIVVAMVMAYLLLEV